MNMSDKNKHLIFVTLLVLLCSIFSQNVMSQPERNSQVPELPEPPDLPEDQGDPDPQPGPDPQPDPNSMDQKNPCVSINPNPAVWEPTVGQISEPGMPFGFPILPAKDVSDECIEFLRNTATGDDIAVFAISLKGDGSNVMSLTMREGAPEGTTYIKNANVSTTETIGFGAWNAGSQVWHIIVWPKTPSSNGVWLRQPNILQPFNVFQSTVEAQTIFFDRPVLWWFDPEAYWSPSTFWKLFSGKLVDFTYFGN
ncbi:MAG: hypothetical protein ABL903_14175 [Methylococcales bacterium]